MKPMHQEELQELRQTCLVIRECLSALRLTRLQDEDIEVAKARLDNWLTENDGRWVK